MCLCLNFSRPVRRYINSREEWTLSQPPDQMRKSVVTFKVFNLPGGNNIHLYIPKVQSNAVLVYIWSTCPWPQGGRGRFRSRALLSIAQVIILAWSCSLVRTWASPSQSHLTLLTSFGGLEK